MQTFLWLWLQHKKVCYLLTGLLSPADCVHITYMIYIHLHVRDHKILCKIMKCKNWVEMICLSVTMHSSCCQHKAKKIHLNCWCLPLSQSRLTETQGKKRVWPVGRENRGRMDGLRWGRLPEEVHCEAGAAQPAAERPSSQREEGRARGCLICNKKSSLRPCVHTTGQWRFVSQQLK